MSTQDELARTAERLRDALSAAADVMAECDATAYYPRSAAARPTEAREAMVDPAGRAACVVAVIAASVLLTTNLARTSSSASQANPGSAGTGEPGVLDLRAASGDRNGNGRATVLRDD